MRKNRAVTVQKKFSLEDRRRRVAEIYLSNRNIRGYEVAQMVGVDPATISRDLKVITKEWQQERIENFEILLERQLLEYEEIKKECREKRSRITNAHQGSRWLEMEINALKQQAKLMGLYAPERHQIVASEAMDKSSRDAAVNAVIITMQDNPFLQKIQKAIEPPKDDDDIIDVDSNDSQ